MRSKIRGLERKRRQLVNKKETEILEFKKSTSEMKDAIISIVSILNKHKGGKLIFGITSNGRILGQEVSEKTLRDISQKISNSIEPKIFPKVYEDKIKGKSCIVVEFSGENDPYYAFGRAYIRVADEDKQMSAKEIERLILGNNQNHWEKMISSKNLKDINEIILKDFIKKSNDSRRINFDYTSSETVLKKLELFKEDRLLKAGEVLFCDNSVEVQAAVFAGRDKDTFLDINKFNGNIVELISKSLSYIKEHMDWRANLTDKGRKEIPEVPVRAVEEAVVNSFAHRDYENPKGNEIAFFDDRIEIYNPGEFPEGVNPEDYIFGNEKSILRNPLIANVLYLGDYIEKWGSGLKRIYTLCKDAEVKVDFKKIKTGFIILFWRGQKPARNQPETSQKPARNQRKEMIVKRIKERTFKKRIFAAELGMNKSTIESDLKELKSEGKIKFVGSRKGGHWKILK